MGDAHASDAEVIAASLDDPERFAEIFRRHHAAVFAYAVRWVGQTQGEEIASDVFVEAFAGRERFDPRFSSARPWLLGFASRLVANRSRRWGRESSAFARHGLVLEATGFEDDLVAEMSVPARWAVMARSLSRDQQEVVALFVFGELSYQEVAEVLGIEEGTVKSRLSRARGTLRNLRQEFDQT